MGKRKFKKTVSSARAGQSTKENIKKKTSSKYSIDELLDKAQDCIDRFEYEVAQKFCQRVLELEPDNVRALETTGSLLMELGDIHGAKQCFGRAVEVQPNKGYSKYMSLGQLFEGSQAVECYQKGIELMVEEKATKEAEEVAMACSMRDEKGVTGRDISQAYCAIGEIYMTDCCFEEDAEGKCEKAVENAISTDSENPEAFQLMASYLLSKEDKERAKENIVKSISLWLPKFRSLQSGRESEEQFDPIQVCPLSFETRLACCKILLEVGEYETCNEVLEGLLDENDEETEVWYLLGWMNHLQGSDYHGNARYYLNKAKEMYKKTKCQDEPLMKHIDELLTQLGPGGDDEDDNDDDDLGEDMEGDDDWETDPETEAQMEEGMDH